MSAIPFALFLILFSLVSERPVSAREITVNTDGNDTEDCLEGDYPCSSLGYVLNHLQSNDCVNIASNSVPLTTIVELHSLNAITIRGQGNTIVMCNYTGGVSCNNCSNVVIEGITWDGCGDPKGDIYRNTSVLAGISFTKVTNLSIDSCILKKSKVRALYLHMVAGIINITGTQVINNANNGVIECIDVLSRLGCSVYNHSIAGGLYVDSAGEEASLYISGCVFSGNGHFGEVNNSTIDCECGATVDGAAIKVFHSNASVPVDITIDHTTFSYNGGYGGGAVKINSTNSPNVNFYNSDFLNNSVVQAYTNSSALMIQLNSSSSTTVTPILNISFCNFTNNSHGRNVIGLVIAGQTSHLAMANCIFVQNKMYQVSLLEMDVQSQSTAYVGHSDFYNNIGSALLYFELHSSNVNISLYDIKAICNNGTSITNRGGLLTYQVFEDHYNLNVRELNFTQNYFERQGGGLYINGIVGKGFRFYVQNSQFHRNIGDSSGTVIYGDLRSSDAFLLTIYNSSFIGNSGGTSIVRVVKRSHNDILDRKLAILLLGKSTIFENNLGGALSVNDVLLVGVGDTTFHSNTVNNGAGLFLGDSFVLLNISYFRFNFHQNFAFVRGGAIYIDLPPNVNAPNCNWLSYENSNEICNGNVQKADGCPVIDGELLCSEITPQAVNDSLCYFDFVENSASAAGNAIYYSSPDLLATENSSDLNSAFYIPKESFCFDSVHDKDISTQPFKVRLEEPAKCTDMDCVTYYITDIMLGEEIEIPAQVVGYNNQSAESVIFFVTCEENCTTSNGSTNYMITGTNPILISDKFGGIKITGIQNGPPLKLHLFSVSLHFDLVVELTGCHSGYTYNKVTMQCECYTTDGIVSCSPEPTIKRDYWFGMVDNTTTVSRCPYTYCKSRHREISPGRFVLPSVQDDQCDSHRTGPACGSCDDGYTIPFDSVECINVDDCHPGYTILVIIGVMVYWVIVIVSTFVLMLWLHHIKCNIGYLYGMIYYYSVVDILLGEIVSRSDDLSSIFPMFGGTIFKLYPGFLFRVCFVQGMDTIDQYVIHFAHPMAVLFFVWLLSKFAVHSSRFAILIAKAAIPTICLILTLAYVSIVNTSLQLLRSVYFTDVDGVFAYLSPGIKFFTGRHIAYVIMAVLFEVVVGFGFPLILLLEPFINHKIDFSRIKPLLDQFQGSYKDEYRWLASGYLISRQVILVIAVFDFSDPFIEKYLFICVCVFIALLHHLLQPYKLNILNKYDGIILHTLLLIASLKIIAIANGFTTEAIVGITYGLYFVPIVIFLIFLGHYIYAIKFMTKPVNTEPQRCQSLASSRNFSQSTQVTYIDEL